MKWLIEWKQWNPETEKHELESDFWYTWKDAVRIFNDCIDDALCISAKVTCFMGDAPYPTNDPVVLEYRL